MMVSNNVAVVPQNDRLYGPSLRDPRHNLEYSLFLKNKIDGEKFWVKYISGGENTSLVEVRWDLFEDAMLTYLQ